MFIIAPFIKQSAGENLDLYCSDVIRKGKLDLEAETIFSGMGFKFKMHPKSVT